MIPPTPSTTPRSRRARAARRVLPLLAASAATLAVPLGADAASARARSKPAARGPTVDVLLQYRERPGLHAFVRSVTDPRSSQYRQYLSVEQIAAQYGAPRSARRAVAAWAASAGLAAETGPSGTFAVVSGPRAAVAGALGGGAVARASASAAEAALPVPAALDGTVASAAVLGERGATAPRAHRSQAPNVNSDLPVVPAPEAQSLLSRYFRSGMLRSGTASGCPAGANADSPLPVGIETSTPRQIQMLGFTPNQYTSAYGIDAMHRRGLRGEGMRIALLETDGFRRGDIETFAACFGLKVPKITQTAVGMRGMPAAGGETTLDLSVLMAAAPRLSNVDIYATNSSPAALLGGAIATLRAGKPKPHAISISLGICEPLLARSVVSARAMSDVFAVAAGAGIGVFVSTGDAGDSGCSRQLPSAIPAIQFPSNLPYVTAVGGTNVALDAANRIASEVVWNSSPGQLAGGGGGLSIMTDRPWYQEALGRTTSGPRGITRVVPDISALADLMPGYALYCTADDIDCRNRDQPTGGWQTIGGTSAATPLMAAGSLLATQEALRSGQPPVGFVNPLLYDLAAGTDRSQVLRDVTTTGNDTTTAVPRDANGGQPIGYYPAKRGYDPASGWGSLKVSAFSRAALRAGAAADGDDRLATRK